MSAVIDRSSVGTLGRQLGRGGQATVYLAPDLRLPDAPGPMVFKEYRDGHRPPSGLVGVADRRTSLTPDDRRRLDESTAWPLRVVKDASGDCGVVLRLIPDGFFQSRRLPGSGTMSRDLREVQNLFVDRTLCQRVGMPFPTPTQRLEICRDLAKALHLVHRHEMVVGDINARNAVFRLDAKPMVMLVDCDAVRIRGSAAVVAQLNAPDWDPPEGPSRLTMQTDRYKFGLFVLRCLAPGSQASTSREAGRAAASLNAAGRDLLARALSGDGTVRPEMREWGLFLNAALEGRAPRAVAPQPRQPVPISEAAPLTTRTPALQRDPVSGQWRTVPL